jgi:hypothetical protein
MTPLTDKDLETEGWQALYPRAASTEGSHMSNRYYIVIISVSIAIWAAGWLLNFYVH